MTDADDALKGRAEEMDMDLSEQIQDRLDGDAGGCMSIAEAMSALRDEE